MIGFRKFLFDFIPKIVHLIFSWWRQFCFEFNWTQENCYFREKMEKSFPKPCLFRCLLLSYIPNLLNITQTEVFFKHLACFHSSNIIQMLHFHLNSHIPLFFHHQEDLFWLGEDDAHGVPARRPHRSNVSLTTSNSIHKDDWHQGKLIEGAYRSDGKLLSVGLPKRLFAGVWIMTMKETIKKERAAMKEFSWFCLLCFAWYK